MENNTAIKDRITAIEPAAVWSEAGDGLFKVPAASFRHLAEQLRHAEGFDFLRSLTGVDEGEEGLGCIYHLENTGTGENGDEEETDNAWFVSFAPADNPRYVVVVNQIKTHKWGYQMMDTAAEIYRYLFEEYDEND